MINTMNTTTYENFHITPKLEAAEALNRILRGEVSAVEAYEQILDQITDDPERSRIETFLSFHKDQVRYWTNQIESKGIDPDTESGPWGLVVKTFVGTAKLFGDSPSIMAMKQGEEHGLSEYRNLLENEYVSTRHKEYVKTEVLPKLELHINSFEAMQKLQ